MEKIPESFYVKVDEVTYEITRVLIEQNNKSAKYGFKTVVDGKEFKLSATFTSEVFQDVSKNPGTAAIETLIDILLNEFKLEISNIKKIVLDTA